MFLKQSELYNADKISVSGNITKMSINDSSQHFVPLFVSHQVSGPIGTDRSNTMANPLLHDGPGRCINIAHHVQLDVLYSNMGHVNGQVVYQVAGARTTYHYATWSASRSILDDLVFPLSSSVRFVEVPAIRESKVKRFVQ